MCKTCESPIAYLSWIACGLDNPRSKIPHAEHADYDNKAISKVLAIKTRCPSLNMHFVRVQTIYAENLEGNSRIDFVDKVQDDVTFIYLKENMPKNSESSIDQDLSLDRSL